MNANQIIQFLTVASEKNLTKASEKLFISQQALSKAISALEEELGVQLFIRTGKGTELTDLGEKILPVTESLLKKYEEHMAIIRDVIQQHHYTITLLFEHAFMPYVIPPDFISKIGEITLKFTIADNTEYCIKGIASGKYDLGFIHKPKQLSGLVYIPVFHERPIVLMNRNHPLAAKKEIKIEDLKNVAQFLPAVSSSAVYMDYIEACIESGFYPKYVFESSDQGILARGIEANKGVVVAGGRGITENDTVISRPLVYKSFMVDMGFLAKPDYSEKLHLKSFVKSIINYYSCS
ncbi:LysR family transcriptional regulator [Lactonifactor longoviformis]|uniref:DNA-binding transcriptional regulator, LysR family n=1 Tax=Lactonifactor longoviformis DSM 17459 TaxID=1122155 RepID=A0A1M4ZYD8_9CLOT|nr:LysR family transcriptional regulator [Lactonifactor longoviformis]POP31834.1 LysR family transcriptional regulator [Lactonifactor longoviformis]SHF22877.1 DNA-binding transcriptional regulator, LysR family [Lactonifactor longoviformis DSM 17459]